ncbi:MAG: TIGR03087 family PEP-CTERM/XrtA system glycosyltransferase [Rhodospirillales bacterium]
MPDLLFLSHRIPYPPDKGDKIRSWHALSHLAQHFRVHLGCFADDPEDLAHEAALRAVCADCLIVPVNPTLALVRSVPALLGDTPISVRSLAHAGMRAWVHGHARRGNLAGVFVFSSAMASHVLDAGFDPRRIVLDYGDVDSDKWRQYARRKHGPMRWIYAREARTLAAFEHAAAASASATLFVSEPEAALFRAQAPDVADRIRVVENGVDHRYFDPAVNLSDPFPAGARAIVFTGRMDYWANIDGVTWFARDILPLVRQRCPQAQFWIVGSHPAKAVQALADVPAVTVTGRVDDVRPYLAHAAVVAAPLRVARGVPNKILEAMSMAKPVVATGQAMNGIRAERGRDILIADEAAAFAAAVADVIDGAADPDVGSRARATVLAHYDWDTNLAALRAIVDAAAGAGR